MYLPRVTVKSAAESRKRQRLPHGTENVLIIDDEISVCEIARDMLTELGYTVYLEHNGRAGVEAYRSRQAMIDLILLDINMPVMGGKDAFELLRGINPSVRIIVMTGYGKGAIETSMFPSEVNGFIQKPFQIELLALTVRDVLNAKRGLPQTSNSA
jgi:CheY-like chemotaxis protein